MTAIQVVQAKIDDLRLALEIEPHKFIDSGAWTSDVGVLLLDVAQAALDRDDLFGHGEYEHRKGINASGTDVKMHEALLALVHGRKTD